MRWLLLALLGRLLALLGLLPLLRLGLLRRRRALRVPLAIGYAAVTIAAGVLLGLPLLGDDRVDERVVTGVPASAATPERGNVQLAAGRFGSIAHPGSGRAAIVRLPNGDRKLTITDFETDNGPDLRVYLSTGDPARGDLGDHEDLGGLKGNIGNQQYTVPKDVDLDRHSTVVIWCRAFSVAFTSAPLEKS